MPVEEHEQHDILKDPAPHPEAGPTMRERLACAALTGVLSGRVQPSRVGSETPCQSVARYVVEFADLVLDELQKTPK